RIHQPQSLQLAPLLEETLATAHHHRKLLGIFVCKSILQKPTLLQRLLRSPKEVCHENRLCACIDSGTEFGTAASCPEEIRLQENLSGESIQHRAQTPGVSSDARSDPRG